MAAAGPAVRSAVLQAAQKSHKSAVCLIPPRRCWGPIQEVRVFHDKSFARWPPHINLLYPFIEAQHFEEAAQLCREALQLIPSFQVTLGSLDFFEHGRSCTLWLRPDAEELPGLQAALEQAFPQCSDLSGDAGRGITSFTPHLSLGQWRTRAQVVAAAQQHGASWQPLTFQAGGVALISREGYDDPFKVRYYVPFGGGQPVAVDVPYFATVGDSCCLAAMPSSSGAAGSAAPSSSNGSRSSSGGSSQLAVEAAERFWIGASRQDGSVWQFAYGANMSPSKLNGVRGLHPLESLPATLPGWRLCFTHRGGMGNLVRLSEGEAGPAGLGSVHGVLHRLSPADYAKLANCEHEYRPVEVEVQPYGSSQPLPAIVFVTPEDRCIADGLPPPQRYLQLLQAGAQHWQLEPAYTQWLASMPSVDSKQRGSEYYTSASGLPLEALPKIRTGSQPQSQGRRRGGQQRQRQRQATPAQS